MTGVKEVIADVVKHTGGLGFIETVKITGTPSETKIEAMDNDKRVFVKGKLEAAVSELVGEFGVTNLPLLDGLLSFASYRTEDASFNVKRRERNGKDVPEEFQFRDGGGVGADFRLMSPDLVPEQPTIMNITWDVQITPSKSKIQELAQLSGLYNEFDKWFSVKTVGDELRFQFGDDNSATHRATMVFEKGIEGELKGDLYWPAAQVLSILKLAGNQPTTMSFTSKGAVQITVQTDNAQYNYVLPSRRR